MTDDDIDFTDDPCPKCGALMVYRQCNACELDPLWYDEDDCETCHECNGLGGWEWCQKCGWDETEKCYLNGKTAQPQKGETERQEQTVIERTNDGITHYYPEA